MNELLYDVDTRLIAASMLAVMVVAMEAGHRVGLSRRRASNEAAREHVNTILGAILGILALLLGFTFSLSLQRFDHRTAAVVEEANAIGTAYLRAQLLAEPVRSDAVALIARYVDNRVSAAALTNVDGAERARLATDAAALQGALWADARKSVEQQQALPITTLFADSLNTMFDSFGRLQAAFDSHVPELVLLLLLVTFLMASALVGFACGISGHRPSLASYLMAALIVVLVFVILDLDRPRRGLIQVNERSLLELQASIRGSVGSPAAQRPNGTSSGTSRE